MGTTKDSSTFQHETPQHEIRTHQSCNDNTKQFILSLSLFSSSSYSFPLLHAIFKFCTSRLNYLLWDSKVSLIHGSSRNRGSKVVWSVICLVYSEIGWGGVVARLWLLVMPLKCSRCRLHSAIPSILCLFIECKYDPFGRVCWHRLPVARNSYWHRPPFQVFSPLMWQSMTCRKGMFCCYDFVLVCPTFFPQWSTFTVQVCGPTYKGVKWGIVPRV